MLFTLKYILSVLSALVFSVGILYGQNSQSEPLMLNIGWDDIMEVTSGKPEISESSPLLAVKSNLLQDFAFVPQYGFCPLPNMALEYYLDKSHWSLGASLDIPWWKRNETHQYFQARNWQVEARRYLLCQRGEYRKMYLQAYANCCVFGISFNGTKAWQGEGLGGGIGAGYVWQLTSRWRLEAGMQLGILLTKYDPFIFGDPIDHIDNGYYYYKWEGRTEDFKERRYRYTWIGPTRVSLSIVYHLFERNRQKGDGR